MEVIMQNYICAFSPAWRPTYIASFQSMCEPHDIFKILYNYSASIHRWSFRSLLQPCSSRSWRRMITDRATKFEIIHWLLLLIVGLTQRVTRDQPSDQVQGFHQGSPLWHSILHITIHYHHRASGRQCGHVYIDYIALSHNTAKFQFPHLLQQMRDTCELVSRSQNLESGLARRDYMWMVTPSWTFTHNSLIGGVPDVCMVQIKTVRAALTIIHGMNATVECMRAVGDYEVRRSAWCCFVNLGKGFCGVNNVVS